MGLDKKIWFWKDEENSQIPYNIIINKESLLRFINYTNLSIAADTSLKINGHRDDGRLRLLKRWQWSRGICGAAGPEAIAQHARLDREMEEEFDEGTATLFPSDRYFLRDYSPYQVRLLDLVTKQNWVASVQTALCAFVLAGQPARTNTLYCYFQ